MSGLGETFRTARESQGHSLSDVADRIHIRSVYLAAIEAEDWQAIGPAVYIRGFLRSYARFLGLDADAAVARFSGQAAGPAVILAPSPRGEPSRSGLSRGDARKPGPSAWAVLGVAVAVALVLFVGYEYFEYRSARPGGAVPLAQASSAAPVQPGPTAPESGSQGAPGTAPDIRAAAKNAGRPSGFAVRLKDSSWLRVVVDGKVAMEGLYPAGTARSFSGRAATVRVGNAGGVDITVDGKDLGPMGGLGDVAERSFQL